MSSPNVKVISAMAKNIQTRMKQNRANEYVYNIKNLAGFYGYDIYRVDELFDEANITKMLIGCIDVGTNVEQTQKMTDGCNKMDRDGYYETKKIQKLFISRLPSIKFLMDEIYALYKTYPRSSITEDGEHISVVIGPFSIDNINFGEFKINIESKVVGAMFAQPTVEALTPNYPEGQSTNSHPHVSMDEICLGNGGGVFSNACFEGRLLDAIEIVSSVLSTLGGDPYIQMEAWTGKQCMPCGRYCEKDYEFSECEGCGSKMCERCLKKCCEYSKALCYNCKPRKFECYRCGEIMCPDCVGVCEMCERKFCMSCIGNHLC